jgi:hypothetical protein
MSREKLEKLIAVHELSQRLSALMPENKASFYMIAYAISLYVDRALAMDKSPPQGPLSSVDGALGIKKDPARDPDDVDMGR